MFQTGYHALGTYALGYYMQIGVISPFDGGGGIDDGYIKRRKRLKRESEDIQILLMMVSIIEQNRNN